MVKNEKCECGAVLDADGNCPYCDNLPPGAVVLHVYDPEFEVDGPYDDYGDYCLRCGKYYLHCFCSEWAYEDIPPLYQCESCGGIEDGCTCGIEQENVIE